MNFLKKHKRIFIWGVIVLLLCAMLLSYLFKTNATFAESAVGSVVAPIAGVTTNISNWFSDRFAYLQNSDAVIEQNNALQAEVERLTRENTALRMYQREHQELAALLEVTRRYSGFDAVTAQIIARNPSNWHKTFIIDKGTRDGIGRNMVVVYAGGLVGRVFEAGYNYAKVITILDDRSSVSGESFRTGDHGVVRGGSYFVSAGNIHPLHDATRMEFIAASAEIIAGDEIITSRLSDVFPEGISIGTVTDVRIDQSNLTKYAIIQPSVNISHLRNVVVLRENFQIPLIAAEEVY